MQDPQVASPESAARVARGGFVSGYGSLLYAATLAAKADLIQLTESGSVALRSRIGEASLWDARAPHPFLCCERWDGLGRDLDGLAVDLVSFTAVSDPCSGMTASALSRTFERVHPFKDQYVAELHALRPSRGHRQEARRSLRRIEVLRKEDGAEWASRWVELYQSLCLRRSLVGGPGRLEPAALAAQLSLPGMRSYAARADGRICSIALWMVQGDVAYYHLAASDDDGYRAAAGYGLMQTALDDFAREGRHLACLGSVPGTGIGYEGLARFKRGWASGALPAFLCGRIFQPAVYQRLSGSMTDSDFFPAYRAPGQTHEARNL